MSQSIHLNAVTPYTVTYTLTSTDFDLATGTAASLEVRYATGIERTWTGAALSGAVGLPSSSLVLTYTFVAGDLDIPGNATLFPVVASPSGNLVGASDTLFIKEKFG